MNAIVYPNQSLHGAVYPAVSLQYALWQKGITLPLVTEETATEAQVVIREAANMPKGSFSATDKDGSLYVEAADLYGFLAAADYLTGTLFAAEIPKTLPAAYVGQYTREMPRERAAQNRLMFHNVWSHDPNGRNFGKRGAAYEIAQVMTYRPDVVGFNEFVDEWRQNTDIMELMHAMGYREVVPPELDRLMINALFYNTHTVRYVEDSCHMVLYGSLNTDEHRHAFVQDGLYYNPIPSRYRCAVAAAFEDLATGARFGACITHLECNAFSAAKVPDDGDPWRAEQVAKLIPFVKQMAKTYGAPFAIGGDYNSTATRIACTALEDAGFVNAHSLAEDADNLCSCHGDPVYSAALDNFVGYNCPRIESNGYFGYDYGIDQIYLLGNIRPVRYRVLSEKSILCSSDHSPVMLDFDL